VSQVTCATERHYAIPPFPDFSLNIKVSITYKDEISETDDIVVSPFSPSKQNQTPIVLKSIPIINLSNRCAVLFGLEWFGDFSH
jgi:hypothetical protein